MSTVPMGVITLYATGFKVSNIRTTIRGPVKWFSERYVERYTKDMNYGKGNTVTLENVGSPYYCVMANHEEYRFHISALEEFFTFMSNKGYGKHLFEVKELPRYYPVAKADFNWVSTKTLREDQIPPVEFLLKDYPKRVAELQTGSGKTLMSQYVLYKSGMRAMIIMQPQFIDRWVCSEGLEAELGVTEESSYKGTKDLIVVNSTADFISLIESAIDKTLDAKLIVVKNTIIRSYLGYHFSSNGDTEKYGCAPEDLMQLLGVGIRIMEETHLDINLNYRMDCCFNTWKTIYLSATLSTNGSYFMRKIFEKMFPEDDCAVTDYRIYTVVKGYSYNVDNPKRFKVNGYMGMYNHALFEAAVIRLGKFRRYMDIVYYMLEDNFFQTYKPGQKAIIYLFRTDLCIEAAKMLKQRYPHLTVTYKIGDVSDKEGYAGDIIVATLKSTGTGKDIPNVAFVGVTISINSEQTNEQVKGRARKPNDDTIPVFAYCYAQNMEKQFKYHIEKKRIFHGKVLGHQDLSTGIVL